jgi:hypothetical protein
MTPAVRAENLAQGRGGDPVAGGGREHDNVHAGVVSAA